MFSFEEDGVMEENYFTYIPGNDSMHDIIYVLILIVWSFFAFITFVKGTKVIFKNDFGDHKEVLKFDLKLSLKYLAYLLGMAVVCGLPLLFNILSIVWVFFYIFVVPFDQPETMIYLEYVLFLGGYLAYLLFLMKLTNERIFTIFKEDMLFLMKFRVLGLFETFTVDDKLAISDKEMKRLKLFFGILLNGGLIPVSLLVLVTYIVGLLS